jgi:hypothetical protein
MTEWRLFVCADCDTDDGALVMRVPDGTTRDYGCPVDWCPGCGSHMGMIGMGEVEVSGRPLVHLQMRAPAEPG